MRKKVTILQHRLLHYRLTLFDRLRDELHKKGIDLSLVHGQASPSEQFRNDEGYLPWANIIRNRFQRVGGTDLCWQSLSKNVVDSDLIILMQENRLLSNYPLMIRRWRGGQRLAYWGHGMNFQSKAPNGIRERVKRKLVHQVDWWFAYTEATVKLLTSLGYPQERITCLNNAIDTNAFKKDILSVTPDRVRNVRHTWELERMRR